MNHAAYGYCPRCGGLGLSRDRRPPYGSDVCENGHSYLSETALANRTLFLPPATERTADTERAAVVAWLRNVGSRMNHGSEYEFVLLSVADAVENGEHRREETK